MFLKKAKNNNKKMYNIFLMIISILSIRKLSKKEIQQPNNYKKKRV